MSDEIILEDKMNLMFIVSGQPHLKRCDAMDLAFDVVNEVLKSTGHPGQDEFNWELRELNGQLVDLTKEIGLELNGDETVFLAPSPGAGA